MTDFIREVDEDLRQDRFKALLERYWIVLAALVVVILGGVGAWKTYEHLTTQRNEAAGDLYLDALDQARDGKGDAAMAMLRQVEAEGTPGYKLLARLRLAGETVAKDPNAAAALFDAIANDPAVEPAIQSAAHLRAAVALIDKLSYADMKKRLDPLADANSPVRNPAREMLALAALKAGQTGDAGHALDAIATDPATSASLRQRADALSGLVRGAGEVPVPSAPPAALPPGTAPPEPAPVPAPPNPVAAPPSPEAPALESPAPSGNPAP